MKTIFVFLLAFSFSYLSFAQKAMTFNEAEQSGIKISTLDSLYKSALHNDSSLAVFKDNQNEFIAAYQDLIKGLSQYLNANNFSWIKDTRCFNRIYFNKTGKIDYFLYDFQAGQLTKEKEAQFDVLLNKFIDGYQFPLKAETDFAQCSPVKYQPSQK
jgi:hypothetical protein